MKRFVDDMRKGFRRYCTQTATTIRDFIAGIDIALSDRKVRGLYNKVDNVAEYGEDSSLSKLVTISKALKKIDADVRAGIAIATLDCGLPEYEPSTSSGQSQLGSGAIYQPQDTMAAAYFNSMYMATPLNTG